MNEMHEHIDHVAREKLFHLEVKPPKAVWSRIEHELNGNKKRWSPIFFRVAAALIIAFGITGLVLKYGPEQSKNDFQAQVLKIKNNNPTVSVGSKRIISHKTLGNQPEIASVAPLNAIEENKAPVQQESVKHSQEPVKHSVAVLEQKNVSKLSAEKLTAENSNNKTRNLAPTKLTGNNVSGNTAININSENMAANTVAPDTAGTKNRIINTLINNTVSQEQAKKNVDIIAAFSQPDNEKTTRNLKWAVSASAGPQYTDQFLNATNAAAASQNVKSSGVLAYAGGLQIEMKPASRFSFQTGVCYSKMGQVNGAFTIDNGEKYLDFASMTPGTNQSIDNSGAGGSVVFNPTGKVNSSKKPVVNTDNQAAPNSISNNTGNVTLSQDASIERYFGFVEVPLLVKYRVIDRKKLDVTLTGGLWTNFLVQNSTYVVVNNQTDPGQSVDVHTVNYSSSLGLGFEYPFASSISISVEPTFRYYLNSIYNSDSYDVRPYSFGIMTGLSYSF